MEEEDARFSSFRAAPIPKAVSDREKVFTPRRSMQPLTEVQNFEFASDRRTRQREQFDMRMAEKQAADDARRRDEEQRRKEVSSRTHDLTSCGRSTCQPLWAPCSPTHWMLPKVQRVPTTTPLTFCAGGGKGDQEHAQEPRDQGQTDPRDRLPAKF